MFCNVDCLGNTKEGEFEMLIHRWIRDYTHLSELTYKLDQLKRFL